MSLIAGIVRRNPDFAISDDLCTRLRKAMAREDTDQVLLYRREGACFAKFDIGAYGWPAVIEGTATFSMLAGDPILQVGGSQERNRAEDLSRIATAFSASQ
jgi:hypothetical protein